MILSPLRATKNEMVKQQQRYELLCSSSTLKETKREKKRAESPSTLFPLLTAHFSTELLHFSLVSQRLFHWKDTIVNTTGRDAPIKRKYMLKHKIINSHVINPSMRAAKSTVKDQSGRHEDFKPTRWSNDEDFVGLIIFFPLILIDKEKRLQRNHTWTAQVWPDVYFAAVLSSSETHSDDGRMCIRSWGRVGVFTSAANYSLMTIPLVRSQNIQILPHHSPIIRHSLSYTNALWHTLQAHEHFPKPMTHCDPCVDIV